MVSKIFKINKNFRGVVSFLSPANPDIKRSLMAPPCLLFISRTRENGRKACRESEG